LLLDNFLLEFKEKNDNKFETKIALFRANHDNSELEKEIKKHYNQLNMLNKKIASNEKSKENQTKWIANIKNTILTSKKSLVQKRNNLEKTENTLEDLYKKKKAIEALLNETSENHRLKKQLEFLKKRINNAEKFLSKINSQITTNIQNIKQFENKLKDFETKLKNILNILLNSYKEKTDLEALIEKKKNIIKDNDKQIEKLEKKYKDY